MRKSTYVPTNREVIIEKTINPETRFVLTCQYQHSKKCKDGKRRNYWLYFLNNVFIFKQKIPYDPSYEWGYQGKTYRRNVYLLNGKIHQERSVNYNDPNPRLVKFPISKIRLQSLNVPPELKINLSELTNNNG